MNNESKKYNGYIRLYLGCMYSNKTSCVINAYNRHIIGGRKCLLVKYKNDKRYSNNEVVTHSGIAVETKMVCQYLCEIDHLTKNYDVICIDEVQFYKDAPIFCDKWANEGLIIEAGGLSGTYEREGFNVINELIPRSEYIVWNHAVCRETGEDASFSMRTTLEKGVEVIGGVDKYDAVDRKVYFNKYHQYDIIDYHCHEFEKFLNLLNDNYHLNINNQLKELILVDFKKNTPECYLVFILKILKDKQVVEPDHIIYSLLNCI